MSSVTATNPAVQHIADHWLHHQFLALDLAEGRVTDAHPMFHWLLEQDVREAQLAALAGSDRHLEVYGGNLYPQMSCYVIGGTPEEPTRRRRIGAGDDLADALTTAHRRLDRPIMLTETSVSGGIRHRQRWLDESVAAVGRARAGGAHVMGYTWFPAFSRAGNPPSRSDRSRTPLCRPRRGRRDAGRRPRAGRSRRGRRLTAPLALNARRIT